MENELLTFRDELISSIMSKNNELSRTDVETAFTDELYNEVVIDTFGVKEATFSEYFSNFSLVMEKLKLKSKYTASILKSIVFGAGGFAGIYINKLKSKLKEIV